MKELSNFFSSVSSLQKKKREKRSFSCVVMKYILRCQGLCLLIIDLSPSQDTDLPFNLSVSNSR